MALPVPYQRPTVDQMVQVWLHAKAGRSNSVATQDRYAATMRAFRTLLQRHGADLDSDTTLVATTAQGWAAHGVQVAVVGPATYNMRLAILSSFYRYSIRQGMFRDTDDRNRENPIERIERRPVQAYANAQALSREMIRQQLAAIDTSRLDGQRDKCLLLLVLATGRRLSEIAEMRREHLTTEGAVTTVLFPRTKGGKVMRDELTTTLSAVLARYLQALDTADAAQAGYDSNGIWIAFGPNGRGHVLSTRGLQRICARHFGTQHFHALRHTFALAMEDSGAKVSEIQARLGHSNLAVTGRYLAKLSSARNPYAGALEAMFIGEGDE